MLFFETAPKALYSIDRLFAGYRPGEAGTFEATLDFQIYLEFISDGGAASTNKPMVLARAEHDCTVMQLLAEALNQKKLWR